MRILLTTFYRVSFLLFLSISIGLSAQASSSSDKKTSSSSKDKEYNPFQRKERQALDFSPYVPRKKIYGLELGATWEEQSFYWVGGSFGFHIGTCLFISQDNCQAYLEFIGGGGGKGSDEMQMAMLGLRWQFVNYPSSWSPYFRLLGGYMHSEVGINRNNHAVFMAGVGLNRHLHKRLDLAVEYRAGYGDQLISQATIGFQIKIDSLVDYFAHKLKQLGRGTIKATGTIIEATGDVISSPFENKNEGRAQDQNNDDSPK